jgi:SAM-dependent methyltransferase
MTEPATRPKLRRRRWPIVAFVLVLVSLGTWWNWPRADASFVGKWKPIFGGFAVTGLPAHETSHMHWRVDQEVSRARCIAKQNMAEVDRYDSTIGKLDSQESEAYRSDLRDVVSFRDGMRVLDVGAGTGTLCSLLLGIADLAVTALDPVPTMLAKLMSKPHLKDVTAIQGHCDSPQDRVHFHEGQFNLIVSRQVANGLYDPLIAFSNWKYWLAPGGLVAIIDGLYERDAWKGAGCLRWILFRFRQFKQWHWSRTCLRRPASRS